MKMSPDLEAALRSRLPAAIDKMVAEDDFVASFPIGLYEAPGGDGGVIQCVILITHGEYAAALMRAIRANQSKGNLVQ